MPWTRVEARSLESFRANYDTCIARAIGQGDLHRKPEWTEGLALGSERYVEEVGKMIDHRMSVSIEPMEGAGNGWVVRETPETGAAGSYSAFSPPEKSC